MVYILTKKSISETVTKFCGPAITWFSRKQKSVSLSTTEAEFIAASEAIKETIWLSRLLKRIEKKIKFLLH